MPTPVDPKRLPALRAALETFGPDDMAAQKDLAALYGVANSRFTTLIKDRFVDFPPAERHADKTHWYNARAAVTAMIAYLEKRTRGNRDRAARAAAVMGRADEAAAAAPPAEQEMPIIGPAELDRLASAATRIWNLAKQKKEYLPAAEVRHAVRRMLQVLNREVMNLPNEIDPNGELPPIHRGRLEARPRAILSKMHDSLEGLLADGDVDGSTARAA